MQKHYVNSFEVPLAASAAGTATPIEMPRDGHDILVEQISITALNATGGVVDGAQTVQFSDLGGTNLTMFVKPQLVRNLVGDGSLPWALPVPWRLPGSARLACDAENLTAAAVTLYVTIMGQRLPPDRDRMPGASAHRAPRRAEPAAPRQDAPASPVNAGRS